MTIGRLAGGTGESCKWLRRSVRSLGLGLLLASCGVGPERGPNGHRDTSHHLVVTPFQTDSSRRGGMARVLAESLAVRLSGLPDLLATVGNGGPQAEFVVRGDLAGRDGRLVIVARLHGAPRDSTLWSATFWRADSLTTGLVDDLASGLAEAIYGHLARVLSAAPREAP